MVTIDGKFMCKATAVGAAGYSAQCLLMPETCRKMYWTDGNTNSQLKFCGHALAGGALMAAAASENPTKRGLQAQAAWWLTAPLLMWDQQSKGQFKKEMAIANTVSCAAFGVGCLVAASKM